VVVLTGGGALPPPPPAQVVAPAARYQFSFGSPRHSPTVTRVYPAARAVTIMCSARASTVVWWTSWLSTIGPGWWFVVVAWEKMFLDVWIVSKVAYCQSRVSRFVEITW